MTTTIQKFAEDAFDFYNHQFPPIKSLWGVGMFEPASRLLINAREGVGKSVFAMNLAIALVRGQRFLGMDVPSRIKVLYLNHEISERQIQERLKKMVKDPSVLKDRLYFKNAYNFDFFTKLNDLKEFVSSKEIDVVIEDCLYKIHNKDENSQKEMKPLLDRFDQLIQETGVATVLIHHDNKSQLAAGGGARARGSTVIPGWVDSQISLTDKKSYVRLEFSKVRNAAKPKDMYIKMNQDLWFEKYEGEDILTRSKTTPELVRAIVARQKEKYATVKILMNETGLPESTVKRALKKAKEKSLLWCNDSRRPHKWTVSAAEVIGQSSVTK